MKKLIIEGSATIDFKIIYDVCVGDSDEMLETFGEYRAEEALGEFQSVLAECAKKLLINDPEIQTSYLIEIKEL